MEGEWSCVPHHIIVVFAWVIHCSVVFMVGGRCVHPFLCVGIHLVFAGPVHWTEKKKNEIKLNPTAKDPTTGCSCTNSENFWLPVARFVIKSKNRSRPVETGLSSCYVLELTYAHIYLIVGLWIIKNGQELVEIWPKTFYMELECMSILFLPYLSQILTEVLETLISLQVTKMSINVCNACEVILFLFGTINSTTKDQSQLVWTGFFHIVDWLGPVFKGPVVVPKYPNQSRLVAVASCLVLEKKTGLDLTWKHYIHSYSLLWVDIFSVWGSWVGVGIGHLSVAVVVWPLLCGCCHVSLFGPFVLWLPCHDNLLCTVTTLCVFTVRWHHVASVVCHWVSFVDDGGVEEEPPTVTTSHL